MKLTNPYSLEKTLQMLRHYLTVTNRLGALELLEKAVSKADKDEAYAQKLKETLLQGSTIQCRDLFSDFGDYFEKPRSEFPFYPHHDNVNAIDSAMHHIKFTACREYFIAGCIEKDGNVFRVEEQGLTNADAEFFTVYGVNQAGMSHAIEDFETWSKAEAYMSLLKQEEMQDGTHH
jgi:hypothetical protein